MLKKNKPVSFTKPFGTMKQCYDCVNDGLTTRHEIVRETKMRDGQVRAALYNLTFIGAILKTKDEHGRTAYEMPGKVVVTANCWGMASSAFGPRV